MTSEPGLANADVMRLRYRLGTTDLEVVGTPNCNADINNDGDMDGADLLLLLGAWGPCTACVEDLDGDDTVGVKDLLILLGSWGPCP